MYKHTVEAPLQCAGCPLGLITISHSSRVINPKVVGTSCVSFKLYRPAANQQQHRLTGRQTYCSSRWETHQCNQHHCLERLSISFISHRWTHHSLQTRATHNNHSTLLPATDLATYPDTQLIYNCMHKHCSSKVMQKMKRTQRSVCRHPG
jgi:hypothetical protein